MPTFFTQINNRTKMLLAVAGILLLNFLLYGHTLTGPFFYDDLQWLYISQQPFSEMLFKKTIYFTRPFLYLYFQWMHAVWGLNPLGYNLANLVIHSANTLLAAWLAFRLTGSKASGFLASIFFSVFFYPCQAVLWISAVSELWLTFFGLAATLTWLEFSRNLAVVPSPATQRIQTVRYAAGLIFFSLSLLSHEAAVVLPVCWLFFLAAEETPWWKIKTSVWLAPFVLLSAVVLIFYHYYYPLQTNAPVPLLACLAILWRSLLTLILGAPIFNATGNQLLLKSHLPPLFSWTLLSMVMILLGAGVAFGLRRKTDAGLRRVLFAGGSWMVLCFSPFVYRIALMQETYVHHRYSYLAAIGFSLLLAGLIPRLYASLSSRPGKIIFTSLLLVYAGFQATALVQFQHHIHGEKQAYQSTLADFQKQVTDIAPGRGLSFFNTSNPTELKARLWFLAPTQQKISISAQPWTGQPMDKESLIFEFQDPFMHTMKQVSDTNPAK